ncbi:SufS family cysteine desulfurase [Candidatus Dependentiae bacterium]|nr:SufS family cysteine desulfurase [Candidatus Dependentiae bacterium]
MSKFDANFLKKDFPIFDNNKDLVYLDSAATTQKPKQMIKAIVDFYEKYNSNVHRSIHELGESSTCFYEQAREKIAKFFNAEPEEIIFTKGTTESINFVADAWAKKNVLKGDSIVTTQVEHHANFLPWMRIAKRNEAKLKYLEIDTNNYSVKDPDNSFWDSGVKLVAVSGNSNVLGDIWQKGQLEKIIDKASSIGAKVLLDASQLAPCKKIDVKKLKVDFMALSAHKMLGPTGIGVLYIKKSLHNKVEPYQVGGSMVQAASFHDVVWKNSPYKFEAGTPPIAQAIGFGAAIDYLNNINFDDFSDHTTNLCNILLDGLQKISGIKIWGNVDKIRKDGHLVCFSLKDVHAHDISGFLGNENISVRSGHHCAQPLATVLRINSSVRVSFYLYNTPKDVQIFLEKLDKTIKFFRN